MDVDTKLQVNVLSDCSILGHNLNAGVELVSYPSASVVPLEASEVRQLIESVHEISVLPPVDLVRLGLAVRVLLIAFCGEVLDPNLVGRVGVLSSLFRPLSADPLARLVQDG